MITTPLEKIMKTVHRQTKYCWACERTLPITNNFWKDRTQHDGYSSRCRDCTKQYMKNYAMRHPLYICWKSMRVRCDNNTSSGWMNYGGRGITYQEEFYDYKSFYELVYPIYENAVKEYGNKVKLTIDRIDVNGNYEVNNIRFVTKRENDNNKRNTVRVEYQGKEWTIPELSGIAVVCESTLRERLRRGWSVKRAVNEPPLGSKK